MRKRKKGQENRKTRSGQELENQVLRDTGSGIISITRKLLISFALATNTFCDTTFSPERKLKALGSKVSNSAGFREGIRPPNQYKSTSKTNEDRVFHNPGGAKTKAIEPYTHIPSFE